MSGVGPTRRNAAEFVRVTSLAGWLPGRIGRELLSLGDSELTIRLIFTLTG